MGQFSSRFTKKLPVLLLVIFLLLVVGAGEIPQTLRVSVPPEVKALWESWLQRHPLPFSVSLSPGPLNKSDFALTVGTQGEKKMTAQFSVPTGPLWDFSPGRESKNLRPQDLKTLETVQL